MASDPITSWQIDGETVETVSEFIFRGSKTTADADCSHEIKRLLLLGRQVMTNLHSILKSRHYFANQSPSSQGCGFSCIHVWMWELNYKEHWALKNWCIWTVVLEKTLESPLDARRSNQSIWKEISPECSLEGLMLKLKLQYLGNLMGRADSFEKARFWERMKAGGEGYNIGWDGWMASPTQWTWVWVNSGCWWWTGSPGMLQFLGSWRVRHDWAIELNWTVLNPPFLTHLTLVLMLVQFLQTVFFTIHFAL